MASSSSAPLFSIITPVFNPGLYLIPAIQSVLRQSCQDFELILVDDGSTESALDEIARMTDPRLRFSRQTNRGAPSACNAGLEIARGEYIAFLDQDDRWAPEKLARHLECFRAHPDVDLTFTWTSYIGEGDQDLGFRPRHWSGRISLGQLFAENVIDCSSAVAIRRVAIEQAGSFDPSLHFLYDLDLCLRVLALRPANGLAIEAVLTQYRRHSDQLSKDWRPLNDDWQELRRKLLSLAPETTVRLAARADAGMMRYFAYVAYERGQFVSGWGLLARGFFLDPPGFATDSRTWKLLLACTAGWALPGVVHRRLQALVGIRPFSGRNLAAPSH